MDSSGKTFWLRNRRIVISGLLLITAGLIAGLVATVGASGKSRAATGASAEACGIIPKTAPIDPGRVLRTFPKSTQANYNGYPEPVIKSPWLTFPGKKPPWQIGVSFGFPNTSASGQAWLRAVQLGFNEAKKRGLVTGSLMVEQAVSAATTTPANQIAGLQKMLRAGADGILILPLSGQALAPVITAAGKRGIPMVPWDQVIPGSPYRIGTGFPGLGGQLTTAAATLRGLGGKGNILIIRTFQGLPLDTQFKNGIDKMLASCPNIHVSGEIFGAGDPATTKTETLKFLTSHPEKIDATIGGGYAGQVLSAFSQAGRPLPKVGVTLVTAGDLAWWEQNPSYCCLYGTVYNNAEHGYYAWRILARVLSGKQLKISNVLVPLKSINQGNYKNYLVPGVPTTSTADVKGSAKDGFAPDSYLDQFFVKKGNY